MRSTTGLAIWTAILVLAGSCPSASAGPCSITLSPADDLQGAIDGAPADRPLHVCLSAGEFRLRRFASIVRDHVTLSGEGPATVLRLDDGLESPVLVVGDYRAEVPRRTTSDVTIEHLRIVGHGDGGSECRTDHPYLTNSAVVVRGGEHIALRDLDVSACRSACLLTERDTRDVAIERNRIAGSVWDGISLNRTAKLRLVGNVIRDNGAAGITAEHLERSVIADNVVAGNRTHGVYLSDSYHNVVTGNRFEQNVLAGVFLTCAVRYHKPLAQCWADSMSRDNVFAGNEFVANRVGFTVASDAAAGCTPGVDRNVSSGDVFMRNPSEEPSWTTFGHCLRYEAAAPASGGTGRAPGV